MRLLKLVSRIFAGTTLLFSGLVGLGTSLALLVSSSLGYLPYSDRPGPGWWGRVHWPAWVEMTTYLGFAPWFAYFCLYFGFGLFVLSLLLGFSSTPRWLNRVIGVVVAGLAATLAVAGAGWYFALSAVGPDSAAIIGSLYGALLFPRFVPVSDRPPALWLRIILPAGASIAFVWWIISPLLPRKPPPNIQYSLVRVTAGDEPVVSAWPDAVGVSLQLKSLNLMGETHGGISGDFGSQGSAPSHYVELIALEPITRSAKLALPESGDVVYVLKGGSWKAYPRVVKEGRRAVFVAPGTDPRFDGARLSVGNERNPQPFTWYPVIPRGR